MANHAIVVGINHYPGLRSLQGPENDALDFRDWVVKHGRVRRGDAQCIVTAKYGPPPPRAPRCKPTMEIVDGAFRRLVTVAQTQGKVGERLYIFLAGHGFAPGAAFGPNLDDAALLMANADLYTLGFHIPGGPYANWFRAAAAFDEVLLFMDCCRDDFGRTPVHFPPFTEKTDPGAGSVRTLYCYATKWSYGAREKLINGNGKVRGVFSYALMEGLRGKAVENGVVTGASLEAYVYNRLPELVGNSGYQEPRFYYDKQRDIQIVRTAVKKAKVTIRWAALTNGASIELSRANAGVSDRHTVQNDTAWQVELPPGVYKVAVAGTSAQKLFEVVGEEALDVQLA